MAKIQDLFDLKGRVAIVTGGGTHLGRAMATALGELGASVVIASRRGELCEQVANEMRGAGMDCTGLRCDATIEEEVDSLVDGVARDLGRLDVMVCNAGGNAAPPTQIPGGSVDEFMRTFELNTKSAYLCANAAAKVMVPQRSGSMIMVGSIHGSLTYDKRLYDGLDFKRGGPAYATAKGGIINLTRYLAGELGQYGITANCISPGQVPRARAQSGFRGARPPQHPPTAHGHAGRPQRGRGPPGLPRRVMDHGPQHSGGRGLEHLVKGLVIT